MLKQFFALARGRLFETAESAIDRKLRVVL